MKTAIYIRVSTQEQVDEGYSISAQKHKLQAYCVAQDWDIVGFYIDEGISAKNTDRPELKRMNDHIKAGLIDCVLVYKLDRLTRSVLDLYKLLEFFDKYDCKFKSASEVYDTTNAMGRLFITIVAALAQWERENLGERVRVGLEEKVRQGKYSAHVKPFGYDLDTSKGELTIIPEEAKIVKRIFKWYLEGKSTYKIANDLIGTPGAKWSDVQVYQILKNPLYKGSLRWRRNTDNYFEVDDAVPPIISKEVFDQVQFHMKTRGMKHPRAAASDYVFTGLVTCGNCGHPLVGSKSKVRDKVYRSYRCKGRALKICNVNIPVEKLERLFLEKISQLRWEQVVNKVDITIDEQEDETEDLEAELKAIAKRRKKFQIAWANDNMTDEEFTEMMKEENEKESAIKEKLQLSTPTQSHSKEDIQLLLLQIEENFTNLTEYEKKTLVSTLLESFVLVRTGEQYKYNYEIKDLEFK
jgi:site-specific DNA recombinase